MNLRRAEEEDDKEDKSPRPDPQSAEIAKALYKSRTVLVFGEVTIDQSPPATAGASGIVGTNVSAFPRVGVAARLNIASKTPSEQRAKAPKMRGLKRPD